MAVQVATYLNYARVCMYLAADGNNEKLLFKNDNSRFQQSTLLFITRKVINWQNNLDSANLNLPQMANYMYSLCDPYVRDARRIIESGATGNIVNPSTGQNVTIATPFIQFVIGESGSLMNAGDTQLTLNYSGVVNPSINVDLDGVEVPYGRSDRVAFTATYNPSNIVIDFNQGVSNGQLYMIHFVQLINV